MFLVESFGFVASGTSGPSFDLKTDVISGVLLETLYGLVSDGRDFWVLSARE